ncbi:MAG TPA: asparagine synthase-related protein [Nitrosomonas sp.]|nr:asparagine synthase-related protein [Nitrosomonas sp.]HMY62478.1 asparagine synthase-related protein [Nitrosomonas sp.]HMY91197.1 asparagine synthase-related protein [Nitrosomonas sp.]HNC41016.1 asparagine synthase-related protein [Nitrosomonas sp.]HNE58769.1 asparagine synthase-related protein [Nitrosomonas sp.]
MTIFAGILARYSNSSIPNSIIEALQGAISRHPDDKNALIEYKNNNIYFAKIDIGALGELGHFTDSQLSGFIAGNPILQQNSGNVYSRLESLKLLASDISKDNLEALRNCRGTYCAAIYDHENGKLFLVTDKIGVRPVYFWVHSDFVIFASALRILESLRHHQKEIDLKGITEIACFGYPLSDRTPYKDIFSLYAGEIVCFDTNKIERKKYWDWNKLSSKKAEDLHLAKQLHATFIESIKIRLKDQKIVAAFLSGGLDSRAIVAALRELNIDVLTANFAQQGSQDQVFGQLAADLLGTHHSHLPRGKTTIGDSYHKLSTINWINSKEFLSWNPIKPRVIWSGDGGSMGLGHIYQNSEIIDAARKKDLTTAKQLFSSYNRWGIFPKLMKRSLALSAQQLLADGIQSELDSIHPEDLGRQFYLFLLLNDQRRHMVEHFENIDLDRIEFELPFFDANFIAEIVQQPVDRFLRHIFYLDWLGQFDSKVLEIPWQAYPGHVPCPLPKPENLEYQWESTQEDKKQAIDLALQFADSFSQNQEFMTNYINKFYFELWKLLLQWGKSNQSYLIRFPAVLYRYWVKVQ